LGKGKGYLEGSPYFVLHMTFWNLFSYKTNRRGCWYFEFYSKSSAGEI